MTLMCNNFVQESKRKYMFKIFLTLMIVVNYTTCKLLSFLWMVEHIILRKLIYMYVKLLLLLVTYVNHTYVFRFSFSPLKFLVCINFKNTLYSIIIVSWFRLQTLVWPETLRRVTTMFLTEERSLSSGQHLRCV